MSNNIPSQSLQDYKAEREKRKDARRRDRGGIFKPLERNGLLDVLMARRRSGRFSPARRSSPMGKGASHTTAPTKAKVTKSAARRRTRGSKQKAAVPEDVVRLEEAEEEAKPAKKARKAKARATSPIKDAQDRVLPPLAAKKARTGTRATKSTRAAGKAAPTVHAPPTGEVVSSGEARKPQATSSRPAAGDVDMEALPQPVKAKHSRTTTNMASSGTQTKSRRIKVSVEAARPSPSDIPSPTSPLHDNSIPVDVPAVEKPSRKRKATSQADTLDGIGAAVGPPGRKRKVENPEASQLEPRVVPPAEKRRVRKTSKRVEQDAGGTEASSWDFVTSDPIGGKKASKTIKAMAKAEPPARGTTVRTTKRKATETTNNTEIVEDPQQPSAHVAKRSRPRISARADEDEQHLASTRQVTRRTNGSEVVLTDDTSNVVLATPLLEEPQRKRKHEPPLPSSTDPRYIELVDEDAFAVERQIRPKGAAGARKQGRSGGKSHKLDASGRVVGPVVTMHDVPSTSVAPPPKRATSKRTGRQKRGKADDDREEDQLVEPDIPAAVGKTTKRTTKRKDPEEVMDEAQPPAKRRKNADEGPTSQAAKKPSRAKVTTADLKGNPSKAASRSEPLKDETNTKLCRTRGKSVNGKAKRAKNIPEAIRDLALYGSRRLTVYVPPASDGEDDPLDLLA